MLPRARARGLSRASAGAAKDAEVLKSSGPPCFTGPGPGGYEVFSSTVVIMSNWGSARRKKGGQLLSQVPPCSTGQGVCRNVVLRRTPKLGGENRALKPPNDPSEVVLY